MFYTRIEHDFGEWFTMEGIQGRWFCNEHGFTDGDRVKIIIKKVRDDD